MTLYIAQRFGRRGGGGGEREEVASRVLPLYFLTSSKISE